MVGWFKLKVKFLGWEREDGDIRERADVLSNGMEKRRRPGRVSNTADHTV